MDLRDRFFLVWKRSPEDANGMMGRPYLACLGDKEDGLPIMQDGEGSMWYEWVEML